MRLRGGLELEAIESRSFSECYGPDRVLGGGVQKGRD